MEEVVKVEVGNAEKLEVFVADGELVGVCFTKNNCEHLFGLAVKYHTSEPLVIPTDGTALVAY